ncbi:MAG: glycoside hydrolase family 3 C-terminal domain-containing protein [Pseudomonadales bacterium]|nr:glycoside hydrolase family 3 C-terminal domain-containing protein [Pseudomonadales bacterium]
MSVMPNLRTLLFPFFLALCVLAGCGDRVMTSSSVEQQVPYLGAEFWPEIDSPVKAEPAMEQKIAEIIAAMTLEEKVGQIIQAEIQYTTPEDVRNYHLGSVLNGGGSLPNRDKHASPADWLAMADAYYDASMDTSDGRVAIPIIWGSDAVHGHNNVIGATIFPHNIGLGATRNPDLIREIGRVTAREMRVTGIDWTFAPTVAVAQDERWGRTYESYSEDPDIVSSYAGEFVIGLQGEPGTRDFLDVDHVVATVKHFLGDGATEGGDDQGDARISEEELRDVHGPGYFTALEAGVQSVMASFSSWNGEKMHGHEYLLTDVLKRRMKFDGLVVGDWNGHGQLPGCTNASCPDAINAGLDLFMAIEDWKDLYRNTLEQARNGVIAEERLNDAVSRILRVKLRAGLFEKGRPSSRGIAGTEGIIGNSVHREVARRAVRQSLVLLKNDNGVLPVASTANILVAGSGANDLGRQTGGWTITWQGTDNDNADFPGATTIVDAISEAVDQSGGSVTHSESGDFDVKPDVAIVIFGEEPYAEFQGDLDTLEFEPLQKTSLALLRKLKAKDIPVVSVFLSGRPMWVNPELNQSDAFVAAWLPGTEGGGVADVLIGDENGKPRFDFTGKLSFSWPGTPLQTRLNPHHENYDPLFALGYGLSYRDIGSSAMHFDEDVDGVMKTGDGDLMLYRGRALAPFAVFVEGDRSEASIMSGPFVTHVSGQVTVQTTDMEVQGDALKVTFDGSGEAGMFIGGGTSMDLERFFEHGVLQFVIRIDQELDGPLMLGVHEKTFELNEIVAPLVGKGWQPISFAMSCFADSASALANVSMPFRLGAASAMQVSVGKIQFRTEPDVTVIHEPCS